MKLEISQILNNNMVRLDFRKNQTCPNSTPSYTIKEDMADEFVSKYNKQDTKLKKVTIASTLIGGIIGAIATNNKKLPLKFLGTILGLISGVLTGLGYALHKRNKLMDKFNVKQA